MRTHNGCRMSAGTALVRMRMRIQVRVRVRVVVGRVRVRARVGAKVTSSLRRRRQAGCDSRPCNGYTSTRTTAPDGQAVAAQGEPLAGDPTQPQGEGRHTQHLQKTHHRARHVRLVHLPMLHARPPMRVAPGLGQDQGRNQGQGRATAQRDLGLST